jgi:hypothetical protein
MKTSRKRCGINFANRKSYFCSIIQKKEMENLMNKIIIFALTVIASVQPCLAKAAPDVQGAILKFLPYGDSQGVTPDGQACFVSLPDGPGIYSIMVGAQGETGQQANGRWASAYIYTTNTQDKYHSMTNFTQDENQIFVRSEDTSERQYVPILPAKIYDLIIKKKNSDGTKSVQVRSGSSASLGWKTDYTCIIK